MNTIPRLLELIKSTLAEKGGSTPIMGSIKRLAAWVLLFLVVSIVLNSLLPGFSIHISTWLNINHEPSLVNEPVLKDLLEAIGTYILGGQALTNFSDTVKHRNTVKYGGDDSDTPPSPLITPTPQA